MRILHTADWHFGRNLEQISRLPEQHAFADELCRLVDQEQIDLVLVAGDVFDTYNPPAAAESLFYETIERLGNGGRRAVVLVAGNHDNPERLCAAAPLAVRNGVYLAGLPNTDPGAVALTSWEWFAEGKTDPAMDGKTAAHTSDPAEMERVCLHGSGPGWMEISVPGCPSRAVLLTLPYPSEARLEEVLVARADESLLQKAYSEKVGRILEERAAACFRAETVNLVVAHLFLLGGRESDSERTLQVGGAMTVSPVMLPAGAQYTALGHLHRPQEVKNSACPAWYAGSPLSYSFSEAGYAKAILLVEAEPGVPAVVTPHYLESGKTLYRWNAENGPEEALAWCAEGRDKDGWIDLEVTVDRPLSPEETKQMRKLHPGLINIRPRFPETGTAGLAPESREGRRTEELVSEFWRHRMGADMPDELMRLFLDVLNTEAGDGETEDGDETHSS